MLSGRNEEAVKPSEQNIDPKNVEIIISKTQTPEENFETECSISGSTIAKGALGVAGLFAGMLYFGPAAKCIELEKCGTWLADLTSSGFARVVFAFGGIDFSGINAYQAAQSVEAYVDYINKQSSTAAKLVKGGSMILFAVTQTGQVLFISLSTSESLLETVLTVGGAAPGALYGASNMANVEIPYIAAFASKIKQFITMTYYNIMLHSSSLNEYQVQEMRRMKYYTEAHEAFLKQVETKWDYVIAHIKAMNPSSVSQTVLQVCSQTDEFDRLTNKPRMAFVRILNEHKLFYIDAEGKQNLVLDGSGDDKIRKKLRHFDWVVNNVDFEKVRQLTYKELKEIITITGFTPKDNPYLSFLLNQQSAEVKPLFDRIAHIAGSLGGGLLACLFSAPILSNSYHIIGKLLPWAPSVAHGAAAGFFSSATVYGHIKITSHGLGGLVDLMVDLIRGRPINSLMYQLHPLMTLIATGGSAAISALSYAVVNVMYQQEVADLHPEYDYDPARYTAILGIVLYHLSGLLHLYGLGYQLGTRNKNEQFFFAVEKELERSRRMSLSDFIKFVEANGSVYGLKSFDEAYPKIMEVKEDNEYKNDITETMPLLSYSAPPVKSSSSASPYSVVGCAKSLLSWLNPCAAQQAPKADIERGPTRAYGTRGK